jgi:5-carboxymethyl-2-hydroxymuconate isomerase
VLAYPAPHYAVADGGAAGVAAGAAAGVTAGGAAGVTAGSKGDYAFAYLNLRMGRGRTEATQKLAGETLLAVAKAFFAPLMATKHMGVTLQIDVGQEVFDAKHSTLHPLFNKA